MALAVRTCQHGQKIIPRPPAAWTACERGCIVAETSPTVRQRELGTRLRQMRNERGMTVEEVAASLLCSATKISRLETGSRRPSLRDVRDLCTLYDVADPTSADLMRLAREAREQGWWTQYEGLGLDPYIGLEQEATSIISYSMHYVPALLQTEDYARLAIKGLNPKIDPDMHGQHVEARLRRQRLLRQEKAPCYRVLMDEAVLHRSVGGAAVMMKQFDMLLEAARLDEATVQVIPFGFGADASQDSNFVLLEFGENQNLGPVVFVEGLAANQYLERNADITRYREAVEYLCDSALSPRDSARLIAGLRAKLASSP
jgi:transcriptional regulator with XRE-family HTH domain